jgi:hypothetical protein
MRLIRTLLALTAAGTTLALAAPVASSAAAVPPFVMYLKKDYGSAKSKPLTIPYRSGGASHDIVLKGWTGWHAYFKGNLDNAFAQTGTIDGATITYPLISTNSQPRAGDVYIHCMSAGVGGKTVYFVYAKAVGWESASLKTYDACASAPYGG